jgi:hypothetical protein
VQYGDTSGGNGCNFDYVRIPGGSEDGDSHTARERFCGQALGFCRLNQGSVTACSPALGAVVTYAKPFTLGVVFDQDEGGQFTASNNPPDFANRGFKLVYNQLPCLN